MSPLYGKLISRDKDDAPWHHLEEEQGVLYVKDGLDWAHGGRPSPGVGRPLFVAVWAHLWWTHSLWAPCVVHVMHLVWHNRFLWFVDLSCK